MHIHYCDGDPYIIDGSTTDLSIKQLLFTLTRGNKRLCISLIDQTISSDCLIRFLTLLFYSGFKRGKYIVLPAINKDQGIKRDVFDH